MPTLTTNGVTLHYLQMGSGPDVVMLHGISGNLAVWHLRMVPLLQDRFRVTTYDLRGHGNSSMPPSGYTTRNMAADLRGLLDELGIERADLVGHSFGADVALHFTLLNPERTRRLALIEPGVPALMQERKHVDWEGWRYWAEILERLTGQPVPVERRNDVSYMVRRSFEVPVVYGPLKGLPRRRDRVLKLLDDTTMVADYEAVDELTLENLATIPHPKLLMYDGASAWMSSFRALRDLLRHCEPVVLPGSELRHFAPLEAPELLVERLVGFLEAPDAEAADGRLDSRRVEAKA